MTPVSLDNFGYILDNVPSALFEKLKNESLIAEKERYYPKGDSVEMHSGLSGSHVPKHFYVTKTLNELNDYLISMFFNGYNKEFNYTSILNNLSHPVSLISMDPWINIQEKHEFIPNHVHDGIVSFVIWVKIPYDINKELSSGEHASTFSFTYNTTIGGIRNYSIRVDKSWEGKIIMFPSALQHCVYPFYTSDDCRISISGNISFDTSKVVL